MCADSISVVFLLAVAIESSLDSSEYEFIKTTVFSKTKSIIQSKFLKRLVVVLIENLPDQGLDQLFAKLSIDENFMEFFSEKYYTYIILAFLGRNHKHTFKVLEHCIHFMLVNLLQTKYFKFMILTFLETQQKEQQVALSRILKTVPQMELAKLRKQEPEYLYFYCFIAIASTPPERSTGINSFLQDLQTAFNLLSELGIDCHTTPNYLTIN